jgi:hypothetical protein
MSENDDFTVNSQQLAVRSQQENISPQAEAWAARFRRQMPPKSCLGYTNEAYYLRIACAERIGRLCPCSNTLLGYCGGFDRKLL